MADVFKFDVSEAIASLEHSVMVDMMSGQLVAFAIVCINEDGKSSHGGEVFTVLNGVPTEDSVNAAINETIAQAMDTNEAAGAEHPCKYVPVAIGIAPGALLALTRQLYKLREEENGDPGLD